MSLFYNFTAIECCSCHMTFGVSAEFYTHRRNDHKRFSLPVMRYRSVIYGHE